MTKPDPLNYPPTKSLATSSEVYKITGPWSVTSTVPKQSNLSRRSLMSERASLCAVEEKLEVEYREIPGYPGYLAGSDGSIWTTKRSGQPRRMSPTLTDRGYFRVTLFVNGKDVSRFVQTLVLEAFIGPRPQGMQACHYPDKCPRNNCVENLRWDTQSENEKDKFRDREPSTATEKKCSLCRVVKPLTDFYRRRSAFDGVRSQCKQCVESSRDWERKAALARMARRAAKGVM